MNAYSVFDAAVQGYGNPIFFQSDAAAQRIFVSEIRESHDSLLSKSPKDFDLYRIGSFDTDTGVFKPEASPVLVAAGRNVLPATISDPA